MAMINALSNSHLISYKTYEEIENKRKQTEKVFEDRIAKEEEEKEENKTP